MEQKRSQPHLAAKWTAYRLWFEYLKIARSSTDPKVRSALVVSKPFYAPWEMEKADKYDPWWKSHSQLFEEKFVVRELGHGEPPADPTALVIEVPLTESPTILTKRVKAIIQAAVDTRAKDKRKTKAKPTATYRMTEGTEPKLDAVREMLSVYRDVYLKNPRLRGEGLLDATHRYYLSRKNKQWRKVPTPLLQDHYEDKVRAMRNVRRYIQKAEKIVLNVARGQFPGRY
jgi:hypothetical protein